MKIIISPARQMHRDLDGFAPESMPRFLPRTRILLEAMRSMTGEELQELWQCSPRILAQGMELLADMDLEQRLTPALMCYSGLAYRYMAPGVFTDRELDYVRSRLRIVSGFYGLLRPFDGVAPYRLEMRAKLQADGCRNLYEFWGGTLAESLAGETDCVIDLASREYSRAVLPRLPSSVAHVTCIFGEEKGGKVIEKGAPAKMARGSMVRWMAENGISRPEDLREFRILGYRFCRERSDRERLVFVKGEGAEDAL